MSQLVRDNGIGKSTGYDYLHEGIDVLAARAPGLHGALLAAKAAGYSHVTIDGVLIETTGCPRHCTLSRVIVVADRPESVPKKASNAGTKSLLDKPCRYSSGITSLTFGDLRHHAGRTA